LTANQAIIQTTGNNIANVNTPGYSRQNAVLETVPGQFTGGGYIGKGVALTSIQRTYSEFLTRQSALAGATSAGDSTRSDKLTQLESIFPGGTDGLGATISGMLNSFSDVASAPTDLTARTVTLTQIDEAASRMRAASKSLDDLQSATAQEISQKVDAINTLAKNIAAVNDQIAKAQGTGQSPNDLLDQRDQLVRDLNQYVQTSTISASDGTVGIFIGGSQALVLGNAATSLSVTRDDFNDPLKTKLALTRSGQTVTLDENTLGGGAVPGLLRFQNTDLVEGRNLLGRLTLAISTSMNDQQKLGLDLDGNPGGNVFTPTDLNTSGNILQPTAPATPNSAAAGNLTLNVSDTTKFVASNYDVVFSSANAGSITRRSDGVTTAFTFTPGTALANGTFAFHDAATGQNDLPSIDGLSLGSVTTSAPSAGDRFLLKPFSTSASNISAEFSTPRALAVASPWVGKMGSTNTGSLQLSSLAARTNPFPGATITPVTPVTLKFIGASQYIRSDDANYANYPDPTGTLVPPTAYNYTSGQAIEYTQTPKYPSPTVPFSVTSTLPSNTPVRLFPAAVDQLAVTNSALLSGGTYTIACTALTPGSPWTASFNVTDSASGITTPFSTSIDPTLPLNIPVTNIPGLSLNLTGDIRVGDSFDIAPATYTAPVLSNWSLTLQGAPKAGDTFTVVDIKDQVNNNGVDYKLNGDNASAMMNLRDVAMFDGSALTDGYASMIAQIGVRSQSATYSAKVSSSVAADLETQRTAISGVNLDEEASKLIQYQQAYQASAKIIQVAQSIFDTLIKTMG
jgi:flagellar hook-associated protein 1 FlgK